MWRESYGREKDKSINASRGDETKGVPLEQIQRQLGIE
jgi:hypothetical protein